MLSRNDIKFECIMCGRVFKSKKEHKCYEGKIVNHNEWDEVRECCIAGCHNLIAADIDEYLCLQHADAFDRFHE